MANKLVKLWNLCQTVNVWQTWRLYWTQPHDRSAQLHICNRSQIHIDKLAKIEMHPKAILEFNMMEDPFKEVRPSRLILHPNSKLVCKGHFQSFEGVRIECLPNAVLEIGDKSYINHDSEIRCREYISLGKNVNIAYNALIQDSDYHTMSDEQDNEKPQTLPIVIEDDVWIGANAIILKGVTLGKGCVVAAGAVVTKSVQAHCLVGGNPARIIKQNIKHS